MPIAAVRREVDARHDLEDVPEEDGEEERREERQERSPLGAQHRRTRCSRGRTGCRARSRLWNLPGTTFGLRSAEDRRSAMNSSIPSSTRNVMKLMQNDEAADLERRAPAAPDEVLRASAARTRASEAPDHRCGARGLRGSVHRSACMRPDEHLDLDRRAARSWPGRTRATNATGENHASWCSSSEQQRQMISRAGPAKPPSATTP